MSDSGNGRGKGHDPGEGGRDGGRWRWMAVDGGVEVKVFLRLKSFATI